MKIKLVRGVLTRDEQYTLAALLLKAGYVVSVRKGGKELKGATVIECGSQVPNAPEEDLS